jgi:hypothetical protein
MRLTTHHNTTVDAICVNSLGREEQVLPLLELDVDIARKNELL